MDGDGHLRQRARVRCSALSWLVIILGNLFVSGVAQGQWTYDSANYSTKAEAIAAMRSARPQNSVLTKELPPTSMNAYSSDYTYTAPPVPISFGAPSYETWCAGASGGCSYASEGDAVTALETQHSWEQCGLGTATPTSDWIWESNLPVHKEYRSYDVKFPSYDYRADTCTPNGIEDYWGIERDTPVNCPQYYATNGIAYCTDPDSATIKGPLLSSSCEACKGRRGPLVDNPIDVVLGEKFQTEADYPLGTLKFIRYYHSSTLESYHQMGVGWTHNYAAHLVIVNNQPVGMIRPEGYHDPLFPILQRGPWGDWIYQTYSGNGIRVYPTSGTFTAHLSDGGLEIYDAAGNLIQLVSPGGTITALNYDTQGRLTGVVDPYGHALGFQYNGNQLLAGVTDPSGHAIEYAYDAVGNLSTAAYPDGTSRTYLYEASGLPNHLTGITDENGHHFSTYGYDPQGRATSSQDAGGALAITVSYSPHTATVTDSLGGTQVFNISSATYAPLRLAGSSYNGLTESFVLGEPFLGEFQQRTTRVTDENGHVTSYGYDTSHLTSKTEAVGTAVARTTGYAYLNADSALPTLITEPLRTTAYTYYTGTNNVQTKTVTDTTVTPNASRVWNYTYDGDGRVLTVDGPRTDVTDVTTYTYYSCTTGYECGQIHTITNAVGQTTTYNTYNAIGQPHTITNANGVVTTLTYDVRQRLETRTTGNETTAFDYWPTGLLKKVTLPDASYLLYTYDDAHRLTQVSDGLGNSTDYSLDSNGNRVAENTYDISNSLHRTHTRVFNALNQLWKDVNATGTAAVTTTYGYDNYGNQTTTAAPLARNTTNAYDELNRLKQITDPANGLTQFGYDANDNLTSVTDPRSLVTAYQYTGFGDLKTQTSPDTGTTANTYDSAGNLATSTDARGAVSTYTYDTLNRVTSVAYSRSGSTDQTITFTYDTGTNGKGHLTGASDAHHSLSWSYDALGRATGKSQTVGSVTQSVGYAYTNGNLTTLTTPSGQSVTYGYNGNHQVTSVAVNDSTVLNIVTYEPLGPVSGWTWGNGTTTTRTYDTDGKISQITGAGTKTYSYDDAFRITGLTDTSPGAANWTYGYDNLDRLTSGTSPSISRGWTYDANGNRLAETGTAPSTYSVSPSSNRITGITGTLARSYGYDPAGNTTGYSTVTASYNNAGRLTTLTNGSSTETSTYNALGQRIQISGGVNGTVLYAYDEDGHLLGEYDGTGGLIEETVWLGDTPVATLRPTGSTVSIYYVHSDQLNTPRQVTRPSDNMVMWTWNSDPFGTDAANASPSGAGVFAFNLRFPGQLFDGQGGLHQNYFRDFDPATGRYVRSDLLGLKGGVNTYAYVGGNPISFIDPFGLTAEDVNVINQYITHNFPDISRRGGYEFGDPGSGANAATDWHGVTTLPASIRCKKLSLEDFENLFDTMLHESMHSTDNALQILWDGLWGNDHLTSNHQGIFNRVQYETQFGHRYPAKSPMWGTPNDFVPNVVDLYNRSREQANKDQCGCQ